MSHSKSLGRNVIGLAWDNARLHWVNTTELASLDGADCVSTPVANPMGIVWDLGRPILWWKEGCFVEKTKATAVPHLTLFGMEMCPGRIPALL